ncbi:MAG: DUF4404 family protein [Planctomycetia bacterium]|nr:DUF4404 family protein [Planctomycetia bacterium]
MADDPQELRGTLARLHEQLRAAPDISGETREMLAGVVNDIHALLAKAGPAGGIAGPGQPPGESIVARLSTAERQFEATHPTLAGIVGSIIDALGRMGI